MNQIYCVKTVCKDGIDYDVVDIVNVNEHTCLKVEYFKYKPRFVKIKDIGFGRESPQQYCISDTKFPNEKKLGVSARIRSLPDGTLEATSYGLYWRVTNKKKVHVSQIKFCMPDKTLKDFPLVNMFWAKVRVEYMIVNGLLKQTVIKDIRWLVMVQYLKLHDANANESWNLL